MARASGGAARGARGRGRPVVRRVAVAMGVVLLAAAALLAAPLADAYAALQWTRHYAAGFGDERPHERVRQAGRWAARAIDGLAPLPAAREAASLALQTGRQFERERPVAARALYAGVRAALERQRASTWRGYGLAALCLEARELEQGVPAAETAAPPPAAGRPDPAPSSPTEATPVPVRPSPTPKAASSPAPRRGARPRPHGARS